MSHNDYTKYSKEKAETTPVVEDVLDVEVEPIVEPATELDAVVPVVEPSRKLGRVSGCTRLNIRKNPETRAEIVCEVTAGTEVEIDESASTADFYKIYTASGIEGYCVKAYIDVNNK